MQISTVFRDNREKNPYHFDRHAVTTEDVTLRTGDYTCPNFCEQDDEQETYKPNFAVERKNGEDFLQSITQDRSRFRSEIERAEDWDAPLLVVIEEPWTLFEQNLGAMNFKNLAPSQVRGTVDTWSERYNVDFFFAGDREYAQQYTFETLLQWMKRPK